MTKSHFSSVNDNIILYNDALTKVEINTISTKIINYALAGYDNIIHHNIDKNTNIIKGIVYYNKLIIPIAFNKWELLHNTKQSVTLFNTQNVLLDEEQIQLKFYVCYTLTLDNELYIEYVVYSNSNKVIKISLFNDLHFKISNAETKINKLSSSQESNNLMYVLDKYTYYDIQLICVTNGIILRLKSSKSLLFYNINNDIHNIHTEHNLLDNFNMAFNIPINETPICCIHNSYKHVDCYQLLQESDDI